MVGQSREEIQRANFKFFSTIRTKHICTQPRIEPNCPNEIKYTSDDGVNNGVVELRGK